MSSRTLTVPLVGFASGPVERRANAAARATSARLTIRALAERLRARRRLGASIAHLDERLLADIGLTPRDRGLGESLIRRFAAGGGIWKGPA